MSTPEVLISEIKKLSPSSVIELFVLDASDIGGDVLYFHAGTNGLRQNITWNGQVYVRYPIQVSGFEFTGQGAFPRPRLRVSNILSAITQILLNYNDLLRAKVIRKRTMLKFLDAVNFPGSVNPSADPTAEFPDDVFYIDRKSSEDRDSVEFELASNLDLVGVALPRRQIIQNICPWKYRGPECGYTGAPIYDINDQPLVGTTPEGIAVTQAFAQIAIKKAALDSAEQALTAASTAKDGACEIRKLETRYVGDTFPNSDGYHYLWKPQTFRGVAFWSSAQVSIGSTYRIGNRRTVITNQVFEYDGISWSQRDAYEIERWGVDSSSCTAATTAYNNALTARDNALTEYNQALQDYDDALAALPLNDPLRTADICGKRLTSCKARFGENGDLPFGGFPASGLFR